MKRSIQLLLLSSLALCAAPVENEKYLTGAWGFHGNAETLKLYEAAGFTMVQAGAQPRLKHPENFHFIAGVSGRPPKDAARPFETADGKLLNSVGLFTHVNFNAPTVEAWWKDLVPQMAARTKDNDRVVFWKVHNEFGYHSGEVFDYSEGSIAKYRAWLQRKYKTIEALNQAWKTEWPSFEQLQPPRTKVREQLPNWLDWRRFTCWNFADYFKSTGDLIRTVVPNAKVSDNFYMTNGMDGWDLFELAKQTDYIAMDIYSIGRWGSLANGMDTARSAARAWNKPFLMMEYHAGPNHWVNEVFGWQLYTEALMALARESRAIQWYMWNSGKSGREEGIHGILDFAGKPTERMTAVTRVSAFTQRFAPILNRAKNAPKVAVLISNDSQYLNFALSQDVWLFTSIHNQLSRILDVAGIPFIYLDAQQAAQNDLSQYKAVILAGVPIVPDATIAKLDEAAKAGTTVIVHPLSAARNEFGFECGDTRPYANAFQDTLVKANNKDQLFDVYPFKDGSNKPFRITPIGKGKRIECTWSLRRLPHQDVDALKKCHEAYRDLLINHAGITPDVTVKTTDIDFNLIEARLLKDKKLNMLFVTKLTPDKTDVTLTLNDFNKPLTGWFYSIDSATVRQLDGKLVDNKLTFQLPLHNTMGGIVLFGEWQPIVDIASISGQDTFRPGEKTQLLVGVVNTAPIPVSGNLKLTLPEGWTATPANGTSYTQIQPGQRAQLAFNLSVPENAITDFFAYQNPILAEVDFTQGVSGTLKAKMLPFVKTTIDVRIEYQGKLLNPWQELTPLTLRWGWDSEVITPPPHPLAVRGNTPANLQFDARVDIMGKPVTLSIAHEDGTKGSIRVADGHESVVAPVLPVVIDVPKAGTYLLTATAGDVSQTISFPACAGPETAERAVQTERQKMLANGEKPGILFGVAARYQSQGTPITVKLPQATVAPDQEDIYGHVFKIENGKRTRQIAMERSPEGVTIPADLPEDGAAVYELLPGTAKQQHNRVSFKETSPGIVVIQGDSYRLYFNSHFGWFEKMDVKNNGEWKPFFRERTGPVLTHLNGSVSGPETSKGVTSLSYSHSPCQAMLVFERPLGNGEVSIKESWFFEPNHIKVNIRMFNLTKAPVAFNSFTYELGANEKTAPNWEIRQTENTNVETGSLPITAQTTAKQHLILKNSDGTALAISLRRCAQNRKWASILNSTVHTAYVTQIKLVKSISIDPGDFILAEFDLWTSEDGKPAVGNPELTSFSMD